MTLSSVRGVSDVEDELVVDPRDHWQDDEIRGAALQALISNSDAPADRVDVAVADGWLTLKGTVKHQRESDAAFEAVSALDGVGGITNKIQVITAGVDGWQLAPHVSSSVLHQLRLSGSF